MVGCVDVWMTHCCFFLDEKVHTHCITASMLRCCQCAYGVSEMTLDVPKVGVTDVIQEPSLLFYLCVGR